MSAPPPPCDWQTTRKLVKERGQYLLETGMWSDCRFIVGTEPNQQVLEGHKLFLAMSSPVFEAMFFGGMAEKDPIAILDVQPDAFKALLEYIYTDKINLTSFDQACELCYGAKKYMLPHLVEECTKYLWSDLYPKNACRAYEFAKLFEEPMLMDKCIRIICNQTQEVLSESSFDDVELSTILTVFDQDELNINSELELFSAITRYAARHNHSSGAKVPRLDGIGNATSEANSNHPTIRDAIMKIRFLTLTPQQFAEGPGKSSLLSESEKFAILMNICSPSAAVSMPEGFSSSATPRRKKHPSEPFCVPLGGFLLVPAQIPMEDDRQPQFVYPELLYAHLLDGDGSRLTYTHFTSRVNYRSLIEISFNRPIYIQRNKVYKVGVVLNKIGCYPIGTYPNQSTCNGVVFTFSQGQCGDSVRDGLIRSIIFSIPSSNNNSSNPGVPGDHKMPNII
ncbi:BTB/POZ domain-containing protein 3 isoform X3 [Anoplophora glabripennis]|uniref:BTB/POZ domain-containing protein 3 isoform X3 n=1 Tax=Anoplophora glabripennis TaxID=217634 RepID=UPI0008743A3F|nr:BTB/POZ domain-containing protein 3 isoform X3 [Anoplophora glabripennis]